MDSFRQYLTGLVGTIVQVERGGPECYQGQLQAVHNDYVTVVDERGAPIYLPIHHLRSVTQLMLPDLPTIPPYQVKDPESFREVLDRALGRLVRVYHAGPELCIGTLIGCEESHLLVEAITGELTCFSSWHVRSLTILTPEMIREVEQITQGR